MPCDLSCNLSTSDILSSNSAPPTDPEVRKSNIIKILKNFREVFFTYLIEDDSNSFKETMDSSESPFKKKTINNEIKFIMENNTGFIYLQNANMWYTNKLRPDDT